jgi:antitoxin component YwqK of YwqJK toxin-antitoxin module
MGRILMIFVGLLSSLTALAQKEVRTYYDPQKEKPQEIYFVLPKNESKKVGKYLRFYENGNVMIEGNYEDGLKSGFFLEHHENGKPARSLVSWNAPRSG